MMPSTYTPPPGRPSYIAGGNVDAALAYSPDIIIMNLPNNDIAVGWTKKEIMDNFRYLRSFILASGTGVSSFFIATTQPRNDISVDRRDSLKTLVDSINNNFGIYAINFWDDLVTSDGNYYLKDEVRHIGFPDEAYHLNDLGHRYIFTRARDKNIFAPNTPLPLKLTGFSASLINQQVKLNWQTEMEEPNTVFEIQYSNDAYNYVTKGTVNARSTAHPAAYTWNDHPLTGDQHFYRLRISESARVTYSKVLHLQFKAGGLAISKIYKNSGATSLFAEISTAADAQASVSITTLSGAVVFQRNIHIAAPGQLLEIPIGRLTSGQYFLQIVTGDNQKITSAFIK